MNLLTVTGENPYPVLVGSEYTNISRFLDKARFTGKILLITDDNVERLYSKKLIISLENAGYKLSTHVIPNGERSKNQLYLREIWEVLIKNDFHREDCIISFGGGVISDLSGLAAATYSRGLKLILIPTTLLSQIDASIGGKNAINFSSTKNIIGTFYSPSVVIADPSLLKTLDDRELSNGMGEAIKYSIIMPTDFFKYLETSVSKNIYHADALKYIIWRCTQYKVDIVNRDPYDQGLRKTLNLGHTFGHAIEAFYGYEQFSHGEAVSIGILLAAKLSIRLKRFQKKEFERIKYVIDKFKLPTKLPKDFIPEIAIDYMMHDKKNNGNGITFIIPITIGKVEEVMIEDYELIIDVIKSFIG